MNILTPSLELKSKLSKKPVLSRQQAMLLLGILFNPEDGGDMFL
jgi:hypothetical protein